MPAAVNGLTAGRTSKQRVVVRGSGSGDQAPVYSRGTRDIEVQHLTLTGAPLSLNVCP
ncbi:hypothetical protein [Flindersiella endophytica]